MSCLLRPWDQHGFDATTDPGPPFTEVLTVITLCFYCFKLYKCFGRNRQTTRLDFKSTFAFGISIMNFDSLITLFLLTLLYLSAVKSAHIPKEGGRSAHDGVISFMEVYNKSLCQPRELLVEILQEYPEEVEHIFIPSCVVLTRCAGCCNDEMLQCTPTSTHNVTMEIKRIKPHKQQNDIFMSFTEHNACECRPKNEVKEQKENQCEPCCDGCLARRKRLFIQNPLTCQCSCRNSDADCKARQLELNERTCRCDKPRR